MYDKGVLSEKVAEDIRKMIYENNLNPGDKLPNEIEMSKIINVGRSTIREAIKILVSTSVLEVRRGCGTFVCDKPGVVKDPLGVNFMTEDDLLLHFFEMRLILEPQVIELAIERGTKDDFNKIEKAYLEVENLIRAGLNHADADIHFHNAIANATHNPIMRRIIPIINDGIIGGYSKTKDNPELSTIVIQHHQRIMDALKERNSKEASAAMREHILWGYNRCKNIS